MTDILLLTPPFVQPNCPYPATAYLTGYLRRKGYNVAQIDLSVEVLNNIFSRNVFNRNNILLFADKKRFVSEYAE